MKTEKVFTHEGKDLFIATGTDEERLTYLADALQKKAELENLNMSQLIEATIELCTDPAEVALLSMAIGVHDACKNCSIRMVNDMLVTRLKPNKNG